MKDVTDDLAPDLTQFLADQGVKPVVAETTLRKMLIVTVDLFYQGAATAGDGAGAQVEGAVGAPTPKLAVATLHCKCFYKQAAQQGAFVARLIEQASKLEGVVGTVVCGVSQDFKTTRNSHDHTDITDHTESHRTTPSLVDPRRPRRLTTTPPTHDDPNDPSPHQPTFSGYEPRFAMAQQDLG